MKAALKGGTLLEPLDPEIDEFFTVYQYCKVFHSTPEAYYARPHHETMMLMKMHDTYEAAVKELREDRG